MAIQAPETPRKAPRNPGRPHHPQPRPDDRGSCLDTTTKSEHTEPAPSHLRERDNSPEAQARRDADREEAQRIRREQRSELKHLLEINGHTDLARRLTVCAQPFRLYCVGCGDHHEIETRCKKRWCPVCAPRQAQDKVERYEARVAAMQWPLFLTLTAPHLGGTDPAPGLKRLRSKFKSFRRLAWWKACSIKGGLMSIEVTQAKDGTSWHWHLHCIIDCRWLAVAAKEPQRGISKEARAERLKAAKHELSEQWARHLDAPCSVTYVARTFGAAVKEALKYSVKPAELLKMADPGILIRAMQSARLVQPWGSIYGLSKELRMLEAEARLDRPKAECKGCGGSNWLPEIAMSRDLKDVLNTAYHGSDRWAAAQAQATKQAAERAKNVTARTRMRNRAQRARALIAEAANQAYNGTSGAMVAPGARGDDGRIARK